MAFTLKFDLSDSVTATVANFMFYGAGVVGSLVVYGLLQERIMTVPYSNSEKFTGVIFLILCNRAVAIIFSGFMIARHEEAFQSKAPFWKYLAISVSNVGAAFCQYEALRYVTFPVQMLCKSFKMMPVMFWGMYVSGKTYKIHDWVIAFMVTAGVTQYLVTEETSDADVTFFGRILLLAYLALDGFTSVFQEKLFKEHETTKYNQMFYINLGSCAIAFVLALISGNVTYSLGFMSEHPSFLLDAGVISGAAVASQWFIYSQVQLYGALVFAATLNVRQVFSILMSYHSYGHFVSSSQVHGLALVFGALFAKSFVGFSAPPEKEGEMLVKSDVVQLDLPGVSKV